MREMVFSPYYIEFQLIEHGCGSLEAGHGSSLLPSLALWLFSMPGLWIVVGFVGLPVPGLWAVFVFFLLFPLWGLFLIRSLCDLGLVG